MKLYQKTKLGKVKFLEFTTDGSKFITVWGQVGGKTQRTEKVCKGTNVGKANETTPEQQAILEMQAKIRLKKKKGYDTKMPKATDTIVEAKIDLDNIPQSFCPNKPIGQKACPKKVLEGKDTYGQRKYNGHCLFLVKGKKTSRVYTRRMEEITDFVIDLPVIKDAMSKVKPGQFTMHEMIYFDKKLKKEVPRHVSSVIHKEDADEALERYKALEKTGEFTLIPFDILFEDHEFVGNKDYLDRRTILIGYDHEVPNIIKNWKDNLKRAQEENWEGFVLRVLGEKSHISYTMDGTAHRAGSWKYKFVKECDCFIDEVLKGKSGKHAKFYAKFHAAQYDDDGNIIDRGYVGPGNLTHEELEELTKDLNSKKRTLPFVVEVEYQSIHDDTEKFEFGHMVRLRDDKKPKECISEE